MKTIIIGNSGSGKTWLAQGLVASAADVIHLDDIFWLPGSFETKRSSDEVDHMIATSKSRDSWICEGVYGDLAKRYFDQAETLIWLDMPWALCKERLEKRAAGQTHLGRTQSTEGLMKLIHWASSYWDRSDSLSHHGHQAIFNDFSGRKFQLQSPQEVMNFLDLPGGTPGLPGERNSSWKLEPRKTGWQPALPGSHSPTSNF
ncbi:MAG: hypothetical protein RL095_529 [Verrucomicrobiota bacterium]|jgi:adenylate kinase family enzyme